MNPTASHFAHARDSACKCSLLEGARFRNQHALKCEPDGITLRSCNNLVARSFTFTPHHSHSHLISRRAGLQPGPSEIARYWDRTVASKVRSPRVRSAHAACAMPLRVVSATARPSFRAVRSTESGMGLASMWCASTCAPVGGMAVSTAAAAMATMPSCVRCGMTCAHCVASLNSRAGGRTALRRLHEAEK